MKQIRLFREPLVPDLPVVPGLEASVGPAAPLGILLHFEHTHPQGGHKKVNASPRQSIPVPQHGAEVG